MAIDPVKLKELRRKSRTHYFGIGSVYCPALKATVNFNSDGYYHMMFKSNREKRTVAAQYSRLILVPLLKPVIKNAKRIHETRVDEVAVAGVKKVRTCFALIEYVGEAQDAKVKVIVRQTGNGGYYLHSAMKVNRNQQTKTSHKGMSQ